MAQWRTQKKEVTNLNIEQWKSYSLNKRGKDILKIIITSGACKIITKYLTFVSSEFCMKKRKRAA